MEQPRPQPGRARRQPDRVMRRRAWNGAMCFDPSAPEVVTTAIWENPDQLLASGTVLKDGDRCTVVRIDQASRPLVLKRYNLKGRFHTFVHMFLRSRAYWCWRNGRMLCDAGVPTPRPLLCLDERRAALLRRRSYLLTEFIPGVSLRDLIDRQPIDPKHLRDLAEQFCRIWQQLGVLRLGHGDMKATNFLVDPAGKLWLIDLDGMRRYRSGPMLRGERRKDIARFTRNWQERPEVAAIFRARIGTG